MNFFVPRKQIASTHGDHTIRVTDIRTGKCTHALNGHPRTPWCIAFHPSNNNILGSGCLGGEVRIWDLQVCTTFFDFIDFTYPHVVPVIQWFANERWMPPGAKVNLDVPTTSVLGIDEQRKVVKTI